MRTPGHCQEQPRERAMGAKYRYKTTQQDLDDSVCHIGGTRSPIASLWPRRGFPQT